MSANQDLEIYIIYEVLHNNKVVYIGSGLPERYEHCMSGKSSSAGLNELFFTDRGNMKVQIIREGLTKKESLEYEKDFIQASQPLYNIQHTDKGKKIKKFRKFTI